MAWYTLDVWVDGDVVSLRSVKASKCYDPIPSGDVLAIADFLRTRAGKEIRSITTIAPIEVQTVRVKRKYTRKPKGEAGVIE